MQHETSYMSFAGEINQENLDELLAFHRATFGGWTMEEESESTDSDESENDGSGKDSQEEDEQEQAGEGEDEASEDDEDESHESSLSREDALKELARVRKEAAKHRVVNKDLLKKLEGAKSPEEIEQIVNEAKAAAADEARALLVENVALKHSLPTELAELLQGNSREELEAHAKKLAKFAPAEEIDPDNLEGGLNGGNDEDGSFDAVAHAKKIRAQRWR